MDPQVYRAAPEVKIETVTRRRPTWLAIIAALIVVTTTSFFKGAMISQSRFEVDLCAVTATVAGFGVVVGIKFLHAAWKKRHDAKLMLEWERRLEEMK